MRSPSNPSKRDKRRGGIAVVAIVLAVIAIIFVGMNIWHGEESGALPESANPHAVEQPN